MYMTLSFPSHFTVSYHSFTEQLHNTAVSLLVLFRVQHIKTQMTHLGWHLHDDTFVDNTPYGPKTFTNIIAVQNLSARRRLTLACHFDSKYFEQFEFIGATDSAVPCALLIDIARHLNDAFSSVRLCSLFALFAANVLATTMSLQC